MGIATTHFGAAVSRTCSPSSPERSPKQPPAMKIQQQDRQLCGYTHPCGIKCSRSNDRSFMPPMTPVYDTCLLK